MALLVAGMACPAPVACCAFANVAEIEDEDGDGKDVAEKEFRSSCGARRVRPSLRIAARAPSFPRVAAQRLAAMPLVRLPGGPRLPIPGSALPLRC